MTYEPYLNPVVNKLTQKNYRWKLITGILYSSSHSSPILISILQDIRYVTCGWYAQE